ncbi:MAG: RimK family alpha-L-glutamate ligase [Pseudomonadota bacterium]
MRPQPLALAVLTIEPGCYSSQRLEAAARARGHDVQCLDTMVCSLHVQSGDLSVHHRGQCLPSFDAVIPRIGPAMTGHGCAVVHQFEAMGVPALARAQAIMASRDKRRAHQLLASAGLPMPRTAFICVPQGPHDILEMMGSLPLVLKPIRSSQGEGVRLVRTIEALQAEIAAFAGQQTDFLVQEFVAEAAGEDVRCLVVGGEVVAAMKRCAAPGEFRSNLHQGGSAEATEITEAERQIAQRAAETFGLSFAGVDLLRGRNGPLVLEVNSSPGLEGIERCTGQDLADLVVAEVERIAAIDSRPLGHRGAAA